VQGTVVTATAYQIFVLMLDIVGKQLERKDVIEFGSFAENGCEKLQRKI
jgi:hypothetical protein